VTTLYIRDVDDAVVETLNERAAAAGMSLSAYVARELTNIATRPTNAEIVQRLKAKDRSAGPSTGEIVKAVRDSRRVHTSTAAVHREEDWYIARCLELDVASQGESVGEALSNLREAVETYLEEACEPTIEPHSADVPPDRARGWG